ncbi:alpha/beta hydrolase fold domain-containing protein [Streptomyces hirsutus]|uniref:alpha/beta hydrolase fold domain-containing protein n=1 Tax=Streptomyces hirsutus TaxID=35620 RepID=UPI0036C71443
MITGNNRGGVPELLELLDGLDLALGSVEYRLAPEIPHPGPIEDCYVGLVYRRSRRGTRLRPGTDHRGRSQRRRRPSRRPGPARASLSRVTVAGWSARRAKEPMWAGSGLLQNPAANTRRQATSAMTPVG